MRRTVTRRKTLKLGVATAGLGTLGSLSGCSSIPVIGSSTSYKQWLYKPGVVDNDDHYQFSFQNYKTVRNNEKQFDSTVYERFEDSEDYWPLDPMSVNFDSVNWNIGIHKNIRNSVRNETGISIGDETGSSTKQHISVGNIDIGGVISGSFQQSDVTTALEDDGFGEDGEYNGYTIYTSGDSQAIAVKNNVAVHSRPNYLSKLFSNLDPTAVVEAIIDTKNGSEESYAADSDDFKTGMNKLGGGTFVFGGTKANVDETIGERDQLKGEVARGRADSVNGKTTKRTVVIVFDSQNDIDLNDIEDWTSERKRFDDVTNISVSQNGRAAVITGQIDTDQLY